MTTTLFIKFHIQPILHNFPLSLKTMKMNGKLITHSKEQINGSVQLHFISIFLQKRGLH